MNIKKLAVIGAVVVCGAANAYPTFTVTPGAYAPGKTAFTADKIGGGYNEVITLTPTSASGGTFTFSLLWTAGNFFANNGQDSLSGLTTGLSANYGLYATFTGGGTFTLSGTSISSFSLNPGGSLNMYLDQYAGGVATSFTPPSVGGGAYTPVGTTGLDDVQIATGSGVSGGATFNQPGGFNDGSFGQTTSFFLTNPKGTSFFTSPNPFYSLSFESGALNQGFTTNGPATVTRNGQLDVIFVVPEPSALLLSGLALLGLGFVSRRRSSK